MSEDRQAFPSQGPYPVSAGMTLREWYAGMAMLGFLSGRPSNGTVSMVALAEQSFKFADEMMKSAEVSRK